MNISAPISSIMTTEVVSVSPQDRLESVKKLLDQHKIHHLPVVHNNNIVGLISKSDFLLFQRIPNTDLDRFTEATRLKAFRAEEIMAINLKTLAPQDSIKMAIDLFIENDFHCIPVIEDQELKGIVTTHDILKMIKGA
ncbi:MAG: hypothetical protein DHS20C18_50670 [Saprospiraceae bacterium]|nr:MAG: hypothetical protein DHS20C18_50670 [Saprospiraceae bacterium]